MCPLMKKKKKIFLSLVGVEQKYFFCTQVTKLNASSLRFSSVQYYELFTNAVHLLCLQYTARISLKRATIDCDARNCVSLNEPQYHHSNRHATFWQFNIQKFLARGKTKGTLFEFHTNRKWIFFNWFQVLILGENFVKQMKKSSTVAQAHAKQWYSLPPWVLKWRIWLPCRYTPVPSLGLEGPGGELFVGGPYGFGGHFFLKSAFSKKIELNKTMNMKCNTTNCINKHENSIDIHTSSIIFYAIATTQQTNPST